MAYDKTKIFEQAKEAIQKHKLFFIEDVVALLPISKPTFYYFFKKGSIELAEINASLFENRAIIKKDKRNEILNYVDLDKIDSECGEIRFQTNTNASVDNVCKLLKNKFKSEKEFINNLAPKITRVIKQAYDLDVDKIEIEKKFHLKSFGFFSIRADMYATTKQGRDILIECKNPKHDKAETFNAFGQIMSYQYLLEKMALNPIVILATSTFESYYFEIIKQFNLKIDVIINNEKDVAFWINDLY